MISINQLKDRDLHSRLKKNEPAFILFIKTHFKYNKKVWLIFIDYAYNTILIADIL